MNTGAEGDVAAYPRPGRALGGDLRGGERVARPSPPWRSGQEPHKEPRFYQDIAVRKVLEAVATGQEPHSAHAGYGHGQDMIAFQIAWKLFQSRWNLSREPTRRPRILFLADRNNLADQAYTEFIAAFPEDKAMMRIEPDEIRRKDGFRRTRAFSSRSSRPS